jgi:hypothetical protein
VITRANAKVTATGFNFNLFLCKTAGFLRTVVVLTHGTISFVRSETMRGSIDGAIQSMIGSMRSIDV